EIQITDSLARLIGRVPFNGFRFAGERFDCGDKGGFLRANIAYALRRPELRGGLTAYLRTLSIDS
ncbi:MAG: UTP--glucose-1-phosphate uridylyltransferase, partial [Alphaproteobacteria bacterium]|nr:UTP--glucose-1-phosphate uridylyltransferase [Alphaproteobacteria bacterium]